jgi:PDZ domain-containing secreted protein
VASLLNIRGIRFGFSHAAFSSCVVFADTPDFDGAPFIQDIDDDSVLFGKMMVGDRLIALDGEDVSDMNAQQVSRLISRKSLQKCRKFQVLRRNEATHRSNKHSTWDPEPSEFGGLV